MAKGRVISDGLNLRLAPGGEVVLELSKGELVTIIKTEQHKKLWHFVHYCNAAGDERKYGWVAAEFVEVIVVPRPAYFPPVHTPAPASKPRDPIPLSLWAFGVVMALAIAALAIAPSLR